MSWYSNVQDWREYIGRRVLVINQLNDVFRLNVNPVEVKVLEVSPSGRYVKLKFGDSVRWVRAEEYVVVEVLD